MTATCPSTKSNLYRCGLCCEVMTVCFCFAFACPCSIINSGVRVQAPLTFALTREDEYSVLEAVDIPVYHGAPLRTLSISEPCHCDVSNYSIYSMPKKIRRYLIFNARVLLLQYRFQEPHRLRIKSTVFNCEEKEMQTFFSGLLAM